MSRRQGLNVSKAKRENDEGIVGHEYGLDALNNVYTIDKASRQQAVRRCSVVVDICVFD